MNFQHLYLSLSLTGFLVPVSPVLAQEFVAYEGRSSVQEGEGGTKKNVEGIDFWSNGAPPRKFKVLGFVDDRRHKTGLIGMVSMSRLESDIVKVAKQHGADAVIVVASSAETVGFVGNNNTTTTGNANVYGNNVNGRAQQYGSQSTAAVQKNVSRYAVIQYLQETTLPALPVATPAATPAASSAQ